MTKARLMQLLLSPSPVAYKFVSSGGSIYRGYLLGVDREDGSGRSFNVTVADANNEKHTFHLRTID